MPRTRKFMKSKDQTGNTREPYFLRSSKGTRNLSAFVFANGTPPGVFFDGIANPGPGIAEKLKLPYGKYQFLDDEAKFIAQINYIMWAAGAPEGDINRTVDNRTVDRNAEANFDIDNYRQQYLSQDSGMASSSKST